MRVCPHIRPHILLFYPKSEGIYAGVPAHFSPKTRAFARAYPGVCPGIYPFQPKNQGIYRGVP